MGPELPDWVDVRDLDPAVRGALRGLDARNAERVAGHLVAAGTLVDEDPEAALAHARAARDRASRVAAVREAVGVAAYYAGDYAEAARELRAYRRMSGDAGYRAVLADCERALGRPEVALRLVTEALAEHPDDDETVELRLVEAGARQELGEAPAARLVLEDALGGRPRPDDLDDADPGRLRLAAAYADLLRAEGETELADRWAAAIDEADPDLRGDAAERLGVEFAEVDAEPAPDDDDPQADVQDSAAADERLDGPSTHDDGDLGGGNLDGGNFGGGAEDDVDADALPEEPMADSGLSFDEEVAAEVADLLGETGPPPADDREH